MRKDGRLPEHADAMLVNQETLSAALGAAAGETPAERFSFIETEPLLSAYCRAEWLQMLGKLALSGASPKVVRGIGEDIHQLIAVTAKAMRTGYCSLLEDFMPEFSVTAPGPRIETEEGDDASPAAQTREVRMKTGNSVQGDAKNDLGDYSAANRRRAKLERLRGVLGLSAAGLTYQQIGGYIGVGSRQRVQQLVVEAVERLPRLARSLGVTGRRHPGRRSKEDHEAEVRGVGNTRKPSSPRASVRTRHMATARTLLNQHGGRYPGATEMMRLGHGALYQFMRKHPHDFERLIRERRVGLGQVRCRRRRRRRY